MQLFKKRAYTTVVEELILPIDFILTQSCSGISLTNIILDDITGGIAPYYPANVTFSDETTALATTDWSITPNSGSTAVYYPETIANTYWVTVKDSVGTVFAKQIYANCWDSSIAPREAGFVGTTGNLSSYTTCGYPPPSDSIYVAIHTTSTLTIGDRVYQSSSGTTVFDGTSGVPGQNKYWKISLMTEFAPCTSDRIASIDQNGFILDLQCCP